MLFFTQCFGAVLDLIHLRFQHYKAKRVFAAAGQLVCVVNPTHNLKVSCSLWFYIHAARVQVLSPPARAPSDPPARARSSWLRLLFRWGRTVFGTQRLTRSFWLSRWLGAFPLTGQNSWSDGLVSFPQASAQEFGEGQKWRLTEAGIRGRPRPSLSEICRQMFNRQG